MSVSGTGWSQSDEVTDNTANDCAGSFGSRSLANAGASGTANVTISATDGAAGFQFAIAPATGSDIIIEVPMGPIR